MLLKALGTKDLVMTLVSSQVANLVLGPFLDVFWERAGVEKEKGREEGSLGVAVVSDL